MPDNAVSASPAVQAQLDRLWALSPGADVLGLGRITRLLARLGDPQDSLPPVFHVAGTNGKGSTCAFLRAMLEAAGHRVHVYTSPHLVRFNERIRIAGTLIDDARLADLLAEVLDAGGDIGASFFEVTTAAAFLAFARVPADACVIEVGLGGRLDATNVLPAPVACGIAALGIDHEAFLLAPEPGTPAAPLDRIGFEKAGIAKPGTPLITQLYPPSVAATVAAAGAARGAVVVPRDGGWTIAPHAGGLRYADAAGSLDLPLPRLAGSHQADNAGLAVAMLRHQRAIAVPPPAIAAGLRTATWPARMQRLSPGPVVDLFAPGTPVWLDGGHNPSAGAALADALDALGSGQLALVLGMLANKDAAGFVAPLARKITLLVATDVPGHESHDPAHLAAVASRLGVPGTTTAASMREASRLAAEARPDGVLIAGSLYLAGEVLALNEEPPT